MTWKELYQKFLDMPRNDLVTICRSTTASCIEIFKKHYNDNDKAYEMFFKLYATFVCADGKAQQDEYHLFNEATGLDTSYEDYFTVMSQYHGKETALEVDTLLDSLSVDDKNICVTLGLAICAIDGTMSVAEQTLIEKYFN